MKKYIDCELACAEVDKGNLLVGNNAEWAKEIINRTPIADVVEVVRCKDCKHGRKVAATKYFKEKIECLHGVNASSDAMRYDLNHFCSRGERSKEEIE